MAEPRLRGNPSGLRLSIKPVCRTTSEYLQFAVPAAIVSAACQQKTLLRLGQRRVKGHTGVNYIL